MSATQTSLAELFTQRDQLLVEAEKLVVDRVEVLLAKVPESCTRFVTECCCGYLPSAFAVWLCHMMENTRGGYGCDANMRLDEYDGWKMYGFSTSDEVLAGLKELEQAWKGQINLDPRVLEHEREVYAIEVLCKVANS